jgi:bifunctional DNA-binding transcriptional regulator/antitoxin component of YhaV-PrlF toxin-antitoxin module
MTPKVKAKEKAIRAGRTTTTRLSAKNQITIPVDVIRKAGFKVGETINCAVGEDGKVILSRPRNPILELSGIGTGLYDKFDLEAERKSWDE